ncbi:hypothetical protein [Indioceanicola profundi]|uniref:hypothetical protein n=1 Tax=Indioceanicola profundi TaxID=2220096 RepID=UPI0013C4C6D9|nr:hypothetical protein [Indioceanicola profundi]
MGEDKKATGPASGGSQAGGGRKDEPAFEQGAKIKPQNADRDKKPTPGHPV